MTEQASAVTPLAEPASGAPGAVPGRYGWVVRGVWLVFLVFPVLSLVTVAAVVVQTVVGLVLVVVFAVTYVVGSQGSSGDHGGRLRHVTRRHTSWCCSGAPSGRHR